jgi:putative Ca2+/H+ antiporter (TMEM165/GDT1 family)
MLYILFATYGTIFVTELLGDKTIYTISSLSLRFPSTPVFCGLTAAFMGKMLVAVLVSQLLGRLPSTLIAGTSAVIFFATALFLGLKKEQEPTQEEKDNYWSRAAVVSFAAVFFSEWADIGQLTAATLAALYRAPVVVWFGATLALVTKGALAMILGIGLRNRVPRRVLRPLAVSVCVGFGILAVFHLLLK